MTNTLEQTAGLAAGLVGDAGALDFVPPWRLRHHHLQSIYPSLPLRRPGVVSRCRQLLRVSREIVVDCGDGVRLLADLATQKDLGRPASDRLAILLHGWEGSS